MPDTNVPIPHPVAPHPPTISTTGAIVITIGALYFGREIFIPLTVGGGVSIE